MARISGAVFSVSLALAGLFSALCPAFAGDRGWVLTQRSTNFGDAYIYISASGLKMVSPKLGCTVVTSAPGWSVSFYNDKTRQFYSTTFEKWTAELNQKFASRGQSLAERPWARGTVGGVAGLKATQYTIRNASMSAKAGGRRQSVNAADCYVADEIQVPSQVSAMISRAYGLPNTRSFPLRITLYTNNSPQTVLDTYRSQTCDIPPTYFGVPAGYARVNSEAEVMMDDESKQILNDLASDSPGQGNNASVAPVPQQPVYTQPSGGQQQYSGQQQYAGQQGTGGSAAAGNGSIALPGGYTLDREKLQKIKEKLLNGNTYK